MDLAGWVVTCVDGLRLVGVEAKTTEAMGPSGGFEHTYRTRHVLSPVYELRVDVVALPAQVNTPKGPALFPVPQMVRQLIPVHGTPSITSYPLPEDARLIDLTTLSADDQRDYAKMIEEVRSALRREESGLVVPR